MRPTTIRIALAQSKMNILDLSKKAGVSRDAIYRCLDGDYTHSKVSTLRRIERALPGVRLVVRLEEEDQQ